MRSITIGNMFINSRLMEVEQRYGWALNSHLEGFTASPTLNSEGNVDVPANGYTGDFGSDTNGINLHMMKNMEWGAVAYLTQSEYGKNAKVCINPSSSYITGSGDKDGNCSSGSKDDSNIVVYNTENGMKTSTTGNIYGIYDMAGGAYEYVAGYPNGGTQLYGDIIKKADSKYYDVSGNSYVNAINIKGDAVYETSSSGSSTNSWHGEYSLFPSSSNWFKRGGNYNNGANAGVFCFSIHDGYAYSGNGWRVCAAVGAGL